MPKEDILLLSTADWENPFWTNKQHVAIELSRQGHKVLYIDSLGLRPPSINKSDVSRILKRLVKGLKFPKKVNNNLWVWSPIVIPFQKYLIIRIINKWVLNFFSKVFIFTLGFNKPLVWTYNPMTLNVFSVESQTKIVYHCVDEIKEQPGMPKKQIDEAEMCLLQRANFVFVTSNKLYESRVKLNSNTYLFSNVADYSHFSKADDKKLAIPNDVVSIKKPIIGFIGAISAYKQDFDLLLYIATKKPDWTIVLIGKVGEGEPSTKVNELEKIQNIKLLGSRSYDSLPGYLKSFDVAIIPAALNEYTHAMFPMKFFEYLAAGKKIVSTNIDSLQEYAAFVYLAKDYDDFVEGIGESLLSVPQNINDRNALAKSKTYQVRTRSMLRIIQGDKGVEE